MKTHNYILGLIIFLASCAGETETPESISLDDFLGETGEVIDQGDTVEIDTTSMVLTGDMNLFIDHQLNDFDTSVHREFHPLDRFTFNQRQKIEFKSKTEVAYGEETMVTPRAEVYYYTFPDTTKTKNAFYNWLDCFGGECDQIKLNEDFEALKMPPQFTMVYDTTIIVVDYRCEDGSFNWKPFQESLISQFGKNYNYQMHVGCGGPLTWK